MAARQRFRSGGELSGEISLGVLGPMVTIERLDIDEAEGPWEEVMEIASRHDTFQSYEWAELEAAVNRNEPIFLIARDGQEVMGGQIVLRRPLLRVLHGHEAIGGPLAQEGRAPEVCTAVIGYLEKIAAHATYITVRPQAGHGLDAVLAGRGYVSSPLHTIVVDLARPEDTIWRSLDGNARTGIKKGVNSGLEVKEATTPTDWAAFAVLQSAHAREKGNAAISPQALEYFREHLLPTGHCRLFVGVLGAECVSGMLFVMCRESMLFYAGASDSRHLDVSPNDPVMWEAMRWGRANGIRQLDLYDTDPREDSPLYGIHRFKAKWGGELVDRPFYVKGRAYLWARERLRNNGSVRRLANVLRGRRLA